MILIKLMDLATPLNCVFALSVTARGACLYVAEHPSEFQGAIPMAWSLKGRIRFQST